MCSLYMFFSGIEVGKRLHLLCLGTRVFDRSSFPFFVSAGAQALFSGKEKATNILYLMDKGG